MPYAINTWQYIDLFIYFSHTRFTIPPPMWTDAAHRHGVPVRRSRRDAMLQLAAPVFVELTPCRPLTKVVPTAQVLGTFIAEWDEGKQDTLALLADRDPATGRFAAVPLLGTRHAWPAAALPGGV